MDPEQLREFEESLRRINELLSKQTETQAALLKGMQAQLTATGHDTNATKLNTDATKKGTEASTLATKMAMAEAEAKEKQARRAESFNQALGSGEVALKSFVSALLSGQQGFTKYGQAVSAAGDAASKMGQEHGILGKIFGGLANVTSKIVAEEFKRLDAQITLKNEFLRMGQVGNGTTRELGELARQAGYSYMDLQKLTKPLQTAGTALNVIDTAGQSGAKTFLELANVGEETRMRFERLGIAQEELTNMQAQYLQLQKLSGNELRQEAKDKALLRKNTLEYAESVAKISALTGKNADTIMEQQRQAMMTFEEASYSAAQSSKIKRLRATGNTADSIEADRLAKEEANRKNLINTVSGLYTPALAQQLAQAHRRQAMGTDTRNLAQMGFTPEEIRSLSSRGEEGMIDLVMLLQQRGGNAAELFQTANLYRGEQFGRETGIGGFAEFEAMANLSGMSRSDIQARMKNFEAQAAGLTGDTAQESKVALTQMEIGARKLAEGVLKGLVDAITPTNFSLNRLKEAAGDVADILFGMSDKAKGIWSSAKDAGKKAMSFAGMATPFGMVSYGTRFFGGSPEAEAVAYGGSTGPSTRGRGPGAAAAAAAGTSLWTTVSDVLLGKKEDAEETADAQETVNELNAEHAEVLSLGTGSLDKFSTAIDSSTFVVRRLQTEMNNLAMIIQGMGMTGISPSSGSSAWGPYKDRYRMGPYSAASGGYSMTGMAAGPAGSLLDMIGRVESSGNYNSLVGGGSANLTEMTVGDVLNYQSSMISRGRESSAVGKYQVIRKTLLGLVNKGIVKVTDKFDKSTQDKIGMALLEGRGYKEFMSGKLSPDQFAFNLSQEWAALPKDSSGISYYAGVGSNRAGIGYGSVRTELANTRSGLGGSVDASTTLSPMMRKNPTEDSPSAARTAEMNERMIKANSEMIGVLSSKLDAVIDRLDRGNDTNNKLLRRSNV